MTQWMLALMRLEILAIRMLRALEHRVNAGLDQKGVLFEKLRPLKNAGKIGQSFHS